MARHHVGEQVLGNFAADGPGVNQPHQRGEVGRLKVTFSDALFLRSQSTGHVGQQPVGELLGVGFLLAAQRLVVKARQGHVQAQRPRVRLAHARRPVAFELLRGQLGHLRPHLGDPLGGDVERGQVRLGKVAVVGLALLRPHQEGLLAALVPAERVLGDGAARVQHLRLPRGLVLDGAGHRAKGVEVLDFHLGAPGLAGLVNGNIHVAAHLAFLRGRVGHAERLRDGLHAFQKGAGLLGAGDVGFRDHFNQRRARPVEVEQRVGRVGRVHELARVVFEVRPLDADALGAARARHVQIPVTCNRAVVLRKLKVLGGVGVKVVLAVKLRKARHVAAQPQAEHHGEFHRPAVEGGQRARQAQGQGVGEFVRPRAVVVGGAGAEDFGPGVQLQVHFEPDDRLIRHGKKDSALTAAHPEGGQTAAAGQTGQQDTRPHKPTSGRFSRDCKGGPYSSGWGRPAAETNC